MLVAMPRDANTTHILLVGQVRPYVREDLQASLPHCQFHDHRVHAGAVEAKGRIDRARGLLGMSPREFTKEELADRNLKRRLRDHPEIKYALAIGEDAQRVLRSTLQDRTDVIGFGSVGALKRCVQRSTAIDLSDLGDRLVDPAYTFEAVAAAAPPVSSTPSRVRLLVGPDNQFGLATSLAQAVATHRPEISAISLSIGEAGFPADIMVSERDWESTEVRRKIRADTRSATHVLVTSDGAEFSGKRRARKRYLSGFTADSVVNPDFALDPRTSSEHSPWLPLVVPAGLLARRLRVSDTPARSLIIQSGSLSYGAARRLAAVGQFGMSELIDVHDVDPVLRLQVAATCAFVLDLRQRPSPDAIVLAALAGGAIVVTDFSDWHGPVEAPPHTPRGSDAIVSLTQALASTSMLEDQRTASKEYVRLHHDGRRTVGALANFLKVKRS